MSVDRRAFLVAAATVGVGALAARSMMSDAPIHPGFDGRSKRASLTDSGTLHIPPGGEYVVSAGGVDSCRMIRWEDRGTLVIEPGGSLVVEDVDDA